MHWGKLRESAASRSSVREDWSARLSTEKKSLFDEMVRRWEDAYAIFSVALDDAFALRAKAKPARARQCAEIASGSIPNLTEPLEAACRTLARVGRHLASPPAVAALNPGFYRGECARQNAQWNQLMHRILFGGRSRFLHKLRVLEITIADSAGSFRRVCDDLSSETHPDVSWLRLDELHYDLNTCLRETVVVLKSFLLALPESALSSFRAELNASVAAACQATRLSATRPFPAQAILGRRAGLFRRE